MARIVISGGDDFSQDRVIITRVFVAVGDRVAAGSRLFECATEKATQEIESPIAGFIVRLDLREGDEFSISGFAQRLEQLIEIEERHLMYPLKFKPVFQERIWGGSRLAKVLGKALPAELAGRPVGESWELADLPPGTVKADSAGAAADGSLSSVITNGVWRGRTLHDVLEEGERRRVAEGQSGVMGRGGAAGAKGGRFPLLIKFLDAQADLSVQVHPSAAYCVKHPGAHLKSEAWYILHAEPRAKIYKGLRAGVTRGEFEAALQNGQVEPLLQAFKVRAGDCHYLESGTVHALGAGILAAEVQTPSDTTFRVFDWNRVGPDGKPRKMHVQEALETIAFDGVGAAAEAGGRDAVGEGARSFTAGGQTTTSRLVTCDYFTLDRVGMAGDAAQDLTMGEPRVWIILEGQGVLQCRDAGPTAFARGDTILLPGNMTEAKVKTLAACTWLEAKLAPR